jgi:8-oxo-dGTP diphosphatase
MKKYVVGLIFDNELKNILMLKRMKAPYQDLYNGVGGKMEERETPKQAMIREIEEETGLTPEFFTKTIHLVSLSFPTTNILLEVFYSVLNVDKDTVSIEKETREGTLEWLSIDLNDLLNASNPQMAGEGNIAYFVQLALQQEKEK